MFRRRHHELSVNTKPDSSSADKACPVAIAESECLLVNPNPHGAELARDALAVGSLGCQDNNKDECHGGQVATQRLSRVQMLIFQSPNDPGSRTGRPHQAWKTAFRTPWSICEQVWDESFANPPRELAEDLLLSLQSPTFNNWTHSDAKLLVFLRHMFVELDLPQQCRFSLEVLENWIFAVYCRYNRMPFHNFKHAFCVTQMMYCCIKQANLQACLSIHDIFILMFSAICHDLDHPGFTNSYQINVQSWLALRYNDKSPLENHHCAVAFDLISNSMTNLVANFTSAEYNWFRKGVIRCIMSTDMTLHDDCVSQFHQLSSHFTHGVAEDHLHQVFLKRPEHRLTFMLTLIKICDISNEIRPLAVAQPWLDCLLEEFFHQARAERLAGLPVLPHMDPEKVTPADNQVYFITSILLPLLTDAARVLPQLEILKLSAEERLIEYHGRLPEKMDGVKSCIRISSTVAFSSNSSTCDPALSHNSICARRSPGSTDQDAELPDHPLLVKCSRLTGTEVVQSRSLTPPPLRILSSEGQRQPSDTAVECSPNRQTVPGDLTTTTTRYRRQSLTYQPPSPASLMFLKFTRLESLADNTRLPDEVVPVAEATSSVSRKSSTGSMVSAIT